MVALMALTALPAGTLLLMEMTEIQEMTKEVVVVVVVEEEEEEEKKWTMTAK